MTIKKGKKSIVLKFLLCIGVFFVSSKSIYSQSICMYPTNNQTYVNAKDGGNITFYKNGKVAINGKIDRRFSYQHTDCVIDLYYKNKVIKGLC